MHNGALNRYPAHQLRDYLLAGDASAVEITHAVFAAIEDKDARIHAYISLNKGPALAQAADVDRRIAKREPVGCLAGIPTAVKDLICTEGTTTTCGSRILEHFVPPYDATVVRKLKDADAVLVGKTNMDEFGMGSSTETSFFGPTRNPHDLDRVPGGSSGGAAAALAAHETILSVGSDTGGSIRQPASHCGVVGLKPTYGRVSRFGLVAYASSLDQIGPLGKDVEDVALLLGVLAGYDERDSTSVDIEAPDYRHALRRGVSGLKIGVPSEYFAAGLDPEVNEVVLAALRALEREGAEIIDVSLPHTKYAIPTYYLIAMAEASSNLARYDGVKYGYRSSKPGTLFDMYCRARSEGFGTEVKRRITLGTYALSAGYYEAYYLKAQRARTLIKQDFERAFERVDVLATPVSPVPPFKVGETINDPLQLYLWDICTTPANLAGIPGISVPCGFSSKGLPVGLQILGKPFAEETVLQVAYTVEQTLDLETA